MWSSTKKAKEIGISRERKNMRCTKSVFFQLIVYIFLITNHISLHFILQVPFTVIQAMGDEFMSCDSYSRRESRVLEAIPCDMTTTNYCKIKGPSYPE